MSHTDNAGFAAAAQKALADLRVIAAQYDVAGLAQNADVALAMGVHMYARPPLILPKADVEEPVTSPPGESVDVAQDLPPAYKGYGIIGVVKRENYYENENKKFTIPASADCRIRSLYPNKPKIRVANVDELPHKILPLAVENDVIAVLLNNAKVYELNRNYPLKEFMEHARPVFDAISFTSVATAIETYYDAMPGLRSSGVIRRIADELESVRFHGRKEERGMTDAEKLKFLSLYRRKSAEESQQPQQPRHPEREPEQSPRKKKLRTSGDSDEDISDDDDNDTRNAGNSY